jgi:hemerythrin-like domain-containing protein
MDFQRQTARRLHEEHEAAFDLCARIEQVLTGRGRVFPPPAGDASWSALARDLGVRLPQDVAGHFEFEERSLFPLLAGAGEGDIAELLADEHRVIRACADEVLGLLARAAAGGLDGAAWQTLKVTALELAERLVAHAQKEEMALLPALDDLLDETQDRDLLLAYVAA